MFVKLLSDYLGQKAGVVLDIADILGSDYRGIETALAEHVPDCLGNLGGRTVLGRRRHENLHRTQLRFGCPPSQS